MRFGFTKSARPFAHPESLCLPRAGTLPCKNDFYAIAYPFVSAVKIAAMTVAVHRPFYHFNKEASFWQNTNLASCPNRRKKEFGMITMSRRNIIVSRSMTMIWKTSLRNLTRLIFSGTPLTSHKKGLIIAESPSFRQHPYRRSCPSSKTGMDCRSWNRFCKTRFAKASGSSTTVCKNQYPLLTSPSGAGFFCFFFRLRGAHKKGILIQQRSCSYVKCC